MSLFDDTISDARRPLVVRRALPRAVVGADEFNEREARDERDGTEPPADYGNSVAAILTAASEERARRNDFQREGQSMSREASYPSGSGVSRLPTGDPLSAGMGAERPKFSATNVGITDVSVMGDSRTNELATGPKDGRSPGKVVAAAVSSESKSHQSDVLPGPIEAEWSCSRSMSMTPEGSTRTVSASGETFLSRPPGRGAPSENPWPAVSPETATRAPVAEYQVADAQAALDAPEAVGSSARRARVAASADDQPSLSPLSPRPAPAQRLHATASRRASEARDLNAPVGRPDGRAATPHSVDTPALSIGRIDVTVIADGTHATAASIAEPFADAGFFACNYLKRL